MPSAAVQDGTDLYFEWAPFVGLLRTQTPHAYACAGEAPDAIAGRRTSRQIVVMTTVAIQVTRRPTVTSVGEVGSLDGRFTARSELSYATIRRSMHRPLPTVTQPPASASVRVMATPERPRGSVADRRETALAAPWRIGGSRYSPGRWNTTSCRDTPCSK